MRKKSAMIEWRSRLDGPSGLILLLCLMVLCEREQVGQKEEEKVKCRMKGDGERTGKPWNDEQR